MIGDDESLIRIDKSKTAMTESSKDSEAVSQLFEEITQLTPSEKANLISKLLGVPQEAVSISLGNNSVEASTVYQFNMMRSEDMANVLDAIAQNMGQRLTDEG